jgi:Mg2+ and Co2+ transporter CorA
MQISILTRFYLRKPRNTEVITVKLNQKNNMSTGRASVFTSGVKDIKMGVSEADIPQGEDKFIWIDLLNPSQEEFEHLQEKFSLHPLSVEDALSSRQVPKIDLISANPKTVFRFFSTSKKTAAFPAG